MQLRDEGALDLDDRLGQHLDGLADGSPTIRRLLAHISGMQREVGEMFVDGTTPTEAELDVAFALDPAQAHHYSNLGFGLLGRVVAAKSGMPYMDYVDERIIRPLGLARTTWYPQEPKAQGYLVDEYARTVWSEPETDLGGSGGDGAALVDRRGSRRPGRRSSPAAPTACSPRRRSRRCGSRRSCTTPTTGCSAGGSA